MEKIVITKKQLNKFDGKLDWAVVDAMELDEGTLQKYEDAKIVEDTVFILDGNGNVVKTLKIEMEENEMENIMKQAWEIAREGQEKFGGKVSEYFAESLKIAWSLAKKEQNHFNAKWKNDNGMEIEIEVEHITEKLIGHWGPWQEERYKKIDEMKVTKLSIGSESVDVRYLERSKRESAIVGETRYKGEHMNITVMLPTEIEKRIWGTYDERQEKKDMIANEIEKEQLHMNKVYKTLECGA